MTKRWTRVWVVIGQVSTLLTAIAAVVGVYVVLAPSGPRIHALCSDYPYELSPDLVETITAARKAESFEELSRMVANSPSITGQCDALARTEIAARMREHLDAAWPKGFGFPGADYKGVHYIKITNDGDRPGADVTLDVPDSGVALVIVDDKAQRIVRAARAIKLGVIRPRTTVNVVLWTSFMSGSWEADKVNVTHSQGVGKVVVGRQLFGVRAAIAEEFGFVVSFAVFVVLSLLYMIVTVMGSIAISRSPAAGTIRNEVPPPGT